MSKHTAGLWHVGMNPGPMVYGPLGEQIADCRGLDESGFNALFIVKACNAYPALLEACKVVVRLHNEGMALPSEMFIAARDAIALAEQTPS